MIQPVVTKPEQFETINQFAQSINEKYKGRLISFGGIHPDCEDYKHKLNQIKESGFLGIKITPRPNSLQTNHQCCQALYRIP